MNLPQMRDVRSSNISQIGYRCESKDLYVNFESSGLYIYRNVPEHIYKSFMEAPSHGRFLNQHIKDKYLFDRF